MRKQPGYAILLVVTIMFTLLAISTLIPQASASKDCILGYKAHCTFTPWSTAVCLVIAAVSCRIRAKFFK